MKLRLAIICLTAIAASVFIVVSEESFGASSRATWQEEKAKAKKGSVENEEIPVVRFEAQQVGKQREIKSPGHDKPIEEMTNITDITESESWIERLPALPIETSDAVLIGTVTQAEAHLSLQKTSVYSEYIIVIDKVLSDKTDLSLESVRTLTAMREGGRVQFSSGHIQTYRMSGQGFLRANRKYVVFVKQNRETQDFLLLTGYQLRKGKVTAVDQIASHSVYENFDETEFLDTVRKAIASTGKGTNQ